MANTLMLVGNSIELNRNLSSADLGVLGPFTIQAAQNGMSTAANFNLNVGGAVGPVPLPSPYPLQPGFAPISDPSQITGPGNYQLTNDVSDLNSIQNISNITIDGARFAVANYVVLNGQNVTLKNCNISSTAGSGVTANTGSNNVTVDNCTIGGTSSIDTSNVTFSHCLLKNSADTSVTDDLILTQGSSLSNLHFLYNIIQGTYDVGIEGDGGWTQCSFVGNYFIDVRAAIGGFWDSNHALNNFTMMYCTFQNNTVSTATGSYGNHLFVINGGGYGYADDDATANSLWGGSGTGLANNNTFSGNIQQ